MTSTWNLASIIRLCASVVAFVGAVSNAVRWARVGVSAHECQGCDLLLVGGRGFGSNVQLIAAAIALVALVAVAIISAVMHEVRITWLAAVGVALVIVGNHLSPLYLVTGLQSFATVRTVADIETYSWLATACFMLAAGVCLARVVVLRPGAPAQRTLGKTPSDAMN